MSLPAAPAGLPPGVEPGLVRLQGEASRAGDSALPPSLPPSLLSVSGGSERRRLSEQAAGEGAAPRRGGAGTGSGVGRSGLVAHCRIFRCRFGFALSSGSANTGDGEGEVGRADGRRSPSVGSLLTSPAGPGTFSFHLPPCFSSLPHFWSPLNQPIPMSGETRRGVGQGRQLIM